MLLLSVLVWHIFFDPPASTSSPPSSSLTRALTGPPAPGSRRPLLRAMVLFQFLACLFVIAWYRFLPFAYSGEMGYCLRRTAVMLLGRVPYRDFAFNYGPGSEGQGPP